LTWPAPRRSIAANRDTLAFLGSLSAAGGTQGRVSVSRPSNRGAAANVCGTASFFSLRYPHPPPQFYKAYVNSTTRSVTSAQANPVG
jgi:hypothetical protein